MTIQGCRTHSAFDSRSRGSQHRTKGQPPLAGEREYVQVVTSHGPMIWTAVSQDHSSTPSFSEEPDTCGIPLRGRRLLRGISMRVSIASRQIQTHQSLSEGSFPDCCSAVCSTGRSRAEPCNVRPTSPSPSIDGAMMNLPLTTSPGRSQ